MSHTRLVASIVLLAPAVCAHAAAPSDSGAEAAPEAEVRELTAILSAALDTTAARVGVAPGRVSPLPAEHGWEGDVPPSRVQAVRRLADERDLRFEGEPPPCACLDPLVGPTVAPRDVAPGDCGWVQALAAGEARASFLGEELDSETGSATVIMSWRVFTPGDGESRPCSYARYWRVELRAVEGSWDAVDSECFVYGMSPDAAARSDPVGRGRSYWELRRTRRFSEIGCSGIVIARYPGRGGA